MNHAYAPSRGLLPAYLVLTFYCLAAAVLAEWQEYHSWADSGPALSAADAAAWNMASATDYSWLTLLPAILLTLVVLALVWNRPPAVPRGVLWAVLACQALAWASYLLGAGPLAAWTGQNPMLNLLVHSDWTRKLLLFLELPLALYMAYRAYGPIWAARRPGPVLRTGNAPAVG